MNALKSGARTQRVKKEKRIFSIIYSLIYMYCVCHYIYTNLSLTQSYKKSSVVHMFLLASTFAQCVMYTGGHGCILKQTTFLKQLFISQNRHYAI